jgi:hypothetical protein
MSTTAQDDAKLGLIGSPYTPVSTAAGIPPTQIQNFDRRFAISAAFQTVTSVQYFTGIYLPAGFTVNGITFMSGATGETSGTHMVFSLYRADTLTLLSTAADNTGGTAFGASLAFREAITTPVPCPYSGLYYLSFLGTASGTMPTILCITSPVTTNLGAVASTAPILAASGATVTTGIPPTTTGALTTIVQCFWAAVD